MSCQRATSESSRIFDHVCHPINCGVDSCEDSSSYTENRAVIRIDFSKVDASNYNHNGNVIDTGANIPFSKLTKNGSSIRVIVF